jgi:hypothetical protein
LKGAFEHGKRVLPLLLAVVVGLSLVSVPALIASYRQPTSVTPTNTTSPATNSKGTSPGFAGLSTVPATSTTPSNQPAQSNQSSLGMITPLVIIAVAVVLSLGVNLIAQRRFVKAPGSRLVNT